MRLVGTGVHEPGRVVTSLALDAEHGRAPGTTEQRCEVVSRRWVAPGETSSVMAASAVRQALDVAGMGVQDLDALVVAAVVPEQPMPTTAVLTLRELGGPGGDTEAFDVNSSSLGFLTGVEIAALGLAAGRWGTVGVVATEVASARLDHDDVEASGLFGDGAAAAVLVRELVRRPGSAVVGLRFELWPDAAGASVIAAGGTRWNTATPPPDDRAYRLVMDSPAVARATAAHLPGFLAALAGQAGFTLPEADLVVPHQASAAGLRLLRERLGVPDERVVDILTDHGNQVSASLPTALHTAASGGRLARGDRVVLVGTGAGFGLGAVALRY